MGIINLEQKYPFLIKYFKDGIFSQDRNLAHCIVFYGTDINTQYEMAIEIARMLNCSGDYTDGCTCLNCNWIRQNKHPAVLTYSKTDNKDPNDTSKNVISIEQARAIKNSLAVTSDYHRVIIFCDRDKDGNICGINETNFQEPTANALLKTFEEPPEKTTFFFLTKDKHDILSTIISRSQCFYIPSLKEESRDYNLVAETMNNYFNIPRNEVLDFYDKLILLTKDYDGEEILNQMQNYICEILKNSFTQKLLKIKLIKDINSIEHAKQELKLNMNMQNVLETLSYSLILK